MSAGYNTNEIYIYLVTLILICRVCSYFPDQINFSMSMNKSLCWKHMFSKTKKVCLSVCLSLFLCLISIGTCRGVTTLLPHGEREGYTLHNSPSFILVHPCQICYFCDLFLWKQNWGVSRKICPLSFWSTPNDRPYY